MLIIRKDVASNINVADNLPRQSSKDGLLQQKMQPVVLAGESLIYLAICNTVTADGNANGENILYLMDGIHPYYIFTFI